MPSADALAALDATEHGLTAGQAQARLAEFGPNVLPHTPPPAWWQILLRQFQSPLIYILGLAALISLAIQEPTDAAFIAAVLCINAAIGGYQEWRAEQSSLALQKLLKVRAAVERDGEVFEVDAEALVPGDVVWLESGNRVPADVRLLMSHGLEVDQSLLTGESTAVQKAAEWSGHEATPVADRLNMAHAAAIVVRGRAKGLVVATGAATVVGQLALDVMASEGGSPPLLVRMERFTKVIAVAVLAASLVIGLLGVVMRGLTIADMFLFAVALAVSAIPEGLPVAMTVALAVATSRMARRGVIVRKLTAVEGLGSCTLVATDKTGTVTCNELTIRELRLADGRVFEVTGEGFAPAGQVFHEGKPVEPGAEMLLASVARVAVLCNEADLHRRDEGWVWRGDPVDVAFLALGHKLGWNREAALDACAQINQIPYEPQRQFAATYHDVDGQVRVLVKGAPERVSAMCRDGADETDRRLAMAEAMARQGYRVLALAEGAVEGKLDPAELPPEPEQLTFLGLAAMIDPLRPGVVEAVRQCRLAGVAVAMITGDHQATALAIARQLGLVDDQDQVVTGTQIGALAADELPAVVERSRVFARVAPHQKLEIVNAARQAGHFVAVTGDGVNDAPALRAANIGIAMGRSGTDVAREAAELVISDDNFATIVSGIEEGRIAYDNIRKVIYLLISTGAAEIVLVGLAVAAGLPLPLLPVQLLWLNLVTNGIQDVALALEPGEGDTLRQRPRSPRERIFNQLMIERTLLGALVMGGVGFAVFGYLLDAGYSELSARNALLALMVLFENVHIGNCRSETKSALVLSPLRSPLLLAGAAAALVVHLAALYHPWGQRILGTEPLAVVDLLLLLLAALSIFVAMELHKLTWLLRRRGSN